MIFSIQRFIEDYLQRRNLSDVDQYAIRVANSFADLMHQPKDEEIIKSVHRIRTVFFQNNSNLHRNDFEAGLVQLLRSRFKKKVQFEEFPGGVEAERRVLLRQPRITIQSIIQGFVRAVESRAIDTFWQSRKKNKLAKRPEKIGQALFAVFTKGAIGDRKSSLVLREVSSGIGFVDIGVVIGHGIHLIEMKLITSTFTGVSQLETYMKSENRKHAWLVFFDARPQTKRSPVPNSIKTPSGTISVIAVDINPTPPSQKRRYLGSAP
jgi:hypothetical protein